MKIKKSVDLMARIKYNYCADIKGGEIFESKNRPSTLEKSKNRKVVYPSDSTGQRRNPKIFAKNRIWIIGFDKNGNGRSG